MKTLAYKAPVAVAKDVRVSPPFTGDRALLPAECSVGDLLNMASEIATHHRRRVRADEAAAFDVYAGSLLARPFALEDLYGARAPAEGRYFETVDWDGGRA